MLKEPLHLLSRQILLWNCLWVPQGLQTLGLRTTQANTTISLQRAQESEPRIMSGALPICRSSFRLLTVSSELGSFQLLEPSGSLLRRAVHCSPMPLGPAASVVMLVAMVLLVNRELTRLAGDRQAVRCCRRHQQLFLHGRRRKRG